jgi:hypothetical protein
MKQPLKRINAAGRSRSNVSSETVPLQDASKLLPVANEIQQVVCLIKDQIPGCIQMRPYAYLLVRRSTNDLAGVGSLQIMIYRGKLHVRRIKYH